VLQQPSGGGGGGGGSGGDGDGLDDLFFLHLVLRFATHLLPVHHRCPEYSQCVNECLKSKPIHIHLQFTFLTFPHTVLWNNKVILLIKLAFELH